MTLDTFAVYCPGMGESLHAHFPAIGRVLGITPSALYSLQVAYLRAGLLDVVEGRGPGSGVQASGKTLAQFLVALATNASIKDNVRDAKAVAKALPAYGVCPLTKAAAPFVDALAAVLADPAMIERVNSVEIGGSLGHAFIRYDGPKPHEDPSGRKYESSVFGTNKTARGIHFQASIPGDVLVALAKVLK